MTASRRPVLVIGVLVFGFLALVAYWAVFYTSGAVQARTDVVYLTFQRSFLLADAWLAACCAVGAIGLWHRRAWGVLFGLLAASSSIFLGLMDVCFNLSEGMYQRGGGAMWLETAINAATLIFGAVIAAVLWSRRNGLLCPAARAAPNPGQAAGTGAARSSPSSETPPSRADRGGARPTR
jgi:hypothetical protein